MKDRDIDLASDGKLAGRGWHLHDGWGCQGWRWTPLCCRMEWRMTRPQMGVIPKISPGAILLCVAKDLCLWHVSTLINYASDLRNMYRPPTVLQELCPVWGAGERWKSLCSSPSQTQSRVMMSIWLYRSRGDTSNLDHGQERLKKVRVMLEFRFQENLGVY